MTIELTEQDATTYTVILDDSPLVVKKYPEGWACFFRGEEGFHLRLLPDRTWAGALEYGNLAYFPTAQEALDAALATMSKGAK